MATLGGAIPAKGGNKYIYIAQFSTTPGEIIIINPMDSEDEAFVADIVVNVNTTADMSLVTVQPNEVTTPILGSAYFELMGTFPDISLGINTFTLTENGPGQAHTLMFVKYANGANPMIVG